MARRGMTTIDINDLTGGEASVFPSTKMPSKFSMLLSNAYITDQGAIGKIPGYLRTNSVSLGITANSGFEFRKSDGTSIKLCAGNGKVFSDASGTMTQIISGLNSGAKAYFSAMNNICIITNGVDAPRKYDGTTVSTLGGSPPATAFKSHVHKGRVWFIERTNKMLATHTDLNNPESSTGSGAGYIDFKYVLKKGDELLDIATFVDLLVFFFRNHIAIYSGSTPSGTGSDFQLVQLIEGCGVIDTGTVQGVGTDMLFVYDSGVKSLRQVVTTGSLNIDNISKLHDPEIRRLLRIGGALSSAHYPGLGWVLFQIGSTVMVYSYTWKAWSRIEGADIKGMFHTADGKLYLCGTNYLYQYGIGYSFDGVSIPWRWETAWLNISRTLNKSFPKLAQIITNPSEYTKIDVQTIYDVYTSSTENLTSFYTVENVTPFDDITDFDAKDPFDDVAFGVIRIPLFGGGKIMKMVFSNTSAVGPVEITEINISLSLGG